jgi:hypothetical protein
MSVYAKRTRSKFVEDTDGSSPIPKAVRTGSPTSCAFAQMRARLSMSLKLMDWTTGNSPRQRRRNACFPSEAVAMGAGTPLDFSPPEPFGGPNPPGTPVSVVSAGIETGETRTAFGLLEPFLALPRAFLAPLHTREVAGSKPAAPILELPATHWVLSLIVVLAATVQQLLVAPFAHIGPNGLPVEVVKAHHDVVDYLAVVGGLVGAFAGIAALVFAARSANDATRSADSADQSLAIMRDEARAPRIRRGQLDAGGSGPRDLTSQGLRFERFSNRS